MSDYDDLRAKALAVDLKLMRWLSVAAMRAEGKSEEDAEYLAAVSPDVVLELLEHHELALAELSLFHDLYDKVLARAEAAEAAVQRVRALAASKEAEAERINNTWDPVTKRYSGVRPFALIDAVREALDGPGAAASDEVDPRSTGGANGAQSGCFVNGSGEPLRDYNEGASGAREGGTA